MNSIKQTDRWMHYNKLYYRLLVSQENIISPSPEAEALCTIDLPITEDLKPTVEERSKASETIEKAPGNVMNSMSCLVVWSH